MSRSKPYVLLFINYGFTLGCLLTHYTSGLLFFGLGAVVWTYCLLKPNSRLLTGYQSRPSQPEAPSFEQVFNDLGEFTYTATGFELPTTTGVRSVNWADIQAMFGYKRDLYTTDLVCLDIFCTDGQGICLHEEIPGWYQFIGMLPANFPSLKPGWEIALTFPAFETNFTLLYERSGLCLQPAAARHYRPESTST
jgi:hypothetical protein